MADTKITSLQPPQVGYPVVPATDVLPIVVIADPGMATSGSTRKVTVNQLLGAGGTATLASATITGDLTVDTNSLYVNSSTNNVGLGTLTPSAASGRALEIYGGAGQSRIALKNDTTGSASTDGSQIALVGSQLVIQNREASEITFETNNSERYRIASDGVATWSNVGGVAGTAMTLNSTGLGLGTSPSYNIDVLAATLPTISVRSTLAGASNARLYLECAGTNSGHITYNRSLQALQLGANGGTTAQVTLDSTGNVGIGVTPSAWFSSRRAVSFGGGSSLSGYIGSPGTELWTNTYPNAAGNAIYVYSNYEASRFYSAGGAFVWENAPNSGASGAGTAATLTPRMTLDASGNLLVGKTSASVTTVGFQTLPSGEASVAMAATTGAATTLNVYSTGAAAYRFFVGLNGTISATNTTISAISDARLKENVQDIDVGLGAILALKPRKFDWKAGKGKDIKGDRGFIAQEFEQVFPQLVDEWKDPAPEGEAPYKSVRQDLIPVLVKAIQELTARVQTLETR